MTAWAGLELGLALGLGLLGLACAPADAHEPQLYRLVPGWGLVDAPVSGVLEGENFLSIPTQHLGGGEAVTLDSDFEVHLGEHLLEDVTCTDAHTLSVLLPAGLAPGWYPVTVRTPLGASVELPRAYYASDRPLAVLSASSALEHEGVWMGEQTHLVLTVDNPGSTRALGVQARLRPVDAPGVEVLSTPSALDVEPGGRALLTWTLGAVSLGTARFALELEGSEELTGAPLQATPAVAALQVGERPQPSSALSLSSPEVNVSQPFTLTLRVTNPGSGALRDVRPETLTVSDVGVSGSLEPVPSRLDLGPGESGDFVWSLLATSPGEGHFAVQASGTDALTGRAVAVAQDTSPPSLDVLTRGRLEAEFAQLPSSARTGHVFTVDVAVKNTGQSGVRDVTLDGAGLVSSGQSCQVRLVSGPDPRGVNLLPGGGRQVFRAQLEAQQPGACSFRVGAVGTDVTDGLPVAATPVSSTSVTITY